MLMFKNSVQGSNKFISQSIGYNSFSFSSKLSRLKFNTQEFEWSKCMETCPKYNRAMGVSFTSKDEVEELIQWLLDTTTDPVTGSLYPDAYTPSIWIPYR